MEDLINLIKKRLEETFCNCGASDDDYKPHSTSCIRAQFIWLIQTEQGKK